MLYNPTSRATNNIRANLLSSASLWANRCQKCAIWSILFEVPNSAIAYTLMLPLNSVNMHFFNLITPL